MDKLNWLIGRSYWHSEGLGQSGRLALSSKAFWQPKRRSACLASRQIDPTRHRLHDVLICEGLGESSPDGSKARLRRGPAAKAVPASEPSSGRRRYMPVLHRERQGGVPVAFACGRRTAASRATHPRHPIARLKTVVNWSKAKGTINWGIPARKASAVLPMPP